MTTPTTPSDRIATSRDSAITAATVAASTIRDSAQAV